MTRIVVVSIGPGNVNYITEAAKKRLQESDLIVGSLRQIEDMATCYSNETEIFVYKKLQEM